jgi:hypothetical protein
VKSSALVNIARYAFVARQAHRVLRLFFERFVAAVAFLFEPRMGRGQRAWSDYFFPGALGASRGRHHNCAEQNKDESPNAH